MSEIISVLLIPADSNKPVRRLKMSRIYGPSSVRSLIGCDFLKSLDVEEGVIAFFDPEGKEQKKNRNQRGTQLLRSALAARDFIASDVLLCGYSYDRSEYEDLPKNYDKQVRQPSELRRLAQRVKVWHDQNDELAWARPKPDGSPAMPPPRLGRRKARIAFDSLARIHGTGGTGDNIKDPLGAMREEGTFEYWHRGRLHREDGPAVGFAGRQLYMTFFLGGMPTYLELTGPANLWFRHGRLHRAGGPAVRDSAGSAMWYVDGRLHREDGPAVEDAQEDTRWWCRRGMLHREGGPAVEHGRGVFEWGDEVRDPVFQEDTALWFHNNELHRVDGPAIRDSAGNERWFRHGKLHREDGPAEINDERLHAGPEGRKCAWFRHGRQMRVEYWPGFADDE